MISVNGGADKIQIDSISLPNFEISWAGGNPLTPGYCFGSDDGKDSNSPVWTVPEEVALNQLPRHATPSMESHSRAVIWR